MNLPDIGTTGILFAVALVMAFFLILVAMIMPKRMGSAVSMTAENIIGMTAFTLAFASVLISINFPLSLADNILVKFVLLLMFIGFVFIQYSVSFWLTAFWASGAIPMIFAGLYLMLATVAISIMAGQSFLADMTAARETELRQASDTYKAALAERSAAANDAARLAVDKADADHAQAQVDRLKNERQYFMGSTAKNASGASVGTVSNVIAKYGCGGHYSSYCAKSSALTGEIAQHEATVRAYRAYQGAATHAERLAATPLPTAQADAQIPGFRALAQFIGYPYEQVRDNFWIFVALFTETAAQLCFIFLGWNRRKRTGAGGVDNVERMNQPGFIDRFAMGVGKGVGEVAAANAPARFVPSDSKSLDSASLDRRKGMTVPCTDCGNPIVLKHCNHMRCDSCRDKHERNYRVKHSKK